MNMADENTLDTDFPIPTTSGYLTASELFSFRKGVDEQLQYVIGQKFYNRSKTWLEEKALESALENHKEILNQKRASRMCDLMKADWNKDLNAAVISKLKGKFIQHMGIILDGKIILSPEESMFLLENKSIEIINSNMPLSTEEAYALMFKKNMSVEKYQVYSHLSQLGFIVVHHQPRLDIAKYEKILNSDKHQVKNKRKSSCSLPEPKEKRLTFCGALSSNLELNLPSRSVINDDSTTSSDCQLLKDNGVMVLDKHQSSDRELSKDKIKSNQNIEVETLEVVAEDNEVISSIPDSTVGNSDAEFIESVDSTPENINVPNLKVPSSISVPGVSDQNVDEIFSSVSDGSEISLHDSQNLDLSNIRRIYHETQNLEESVVDVDSIEVAEGESNLEKSDVISCSSGDDVGDVEDLDNDTNVTIIREHAVDDDITLLEVKKKETKPLAVIDLLSDEEQEERVCNEKNGESDDEIQVVKVCSGPSNRSKVSSRKLDIAKCKKEMHASRRISPKRSFHPLMKFPDLFKKDVACVPRPPMSLLPNHVQPKKEVYVLNFEKQARPQVQPRVWNSYKDLQDYQRARHRNKYPDSTSDRFQRHDNRQLYGQNFRQNPGPSRDQVHRYSNNNSRDYSDRHSNHNFPPNFENSSQDSLRDSRQLECPYYRDDTASVVERGRNLRIPVDTEGIEPMLTDTTLQMNFAPDIRNLPHVRTAQFIAEFQRTAYSFATTMLSSMLNRHLMNPNSIEDICNSNINVSVSNGSNFSQRHNGFSNFSRNNENQANLRSDMRPNAFSSQYPSDSAYSRQSYEVQSQTYIPNSRRNRDYRQRYVPHRGIPFPCPYRNASNKSSWNEIKAAVGRQNDDDLCEDNNSDIEEVPINVNQVLWSNDIQPLVKPGIKHNISDVLKSIRITQMANLLDSRQNNEKYLPSASYLEISYDVYLPGTNYKRSGPGSPKYRLVVVRASDPVPKYSELVFLQRKWNDGAILQIAVVDNGDISFYTFNSISLPQIIPFDT